MSFNYCWASQFSIAPLNTNLPRSSATGFDVFWKTCESFIQIKTRHLMLTEFNRGAEINVYLRNQRTLPSLFHTVNLLVMLQFLYYFSFAKSWRSWHIYAALIYWLKFGSITMYNILHGFYTKQNKQNIYWLIDHQLNDNNLITIPVIERGNDPRSCSCHFIYFYSLQ